MPLRLVLVAFSAARRHKPMDRTDEENDPASFCHSIVSAERLRYPPMLP
jgi:hypothetical protein